MRDLGHFTLTFEQLDCSLPVTVSAARRSQLSPDVDVVGPRLTERAQQLDGPRRVAVARHGTMGQPSRHEFHVAALIRIEMEPLLEHIERSLQVFFNRHRTVGPHHPFGFAAAVDDLFRR